MALTAGAYGMIDLSWLVVELRAKVSLQTSERLLMQGRSLTGAGTAKGLIASSIMNFEIYP